MFDFSIFTQPVSADRPCGSDLDREGDVQYLNFFAAAEPKLPRSYFEVKDSNGDLKRFDPKSFDSESLFEAAQPLFSRTRDLRLAVLLAKVSILARNLDSFINFLDAIAGLLDRQWEGVHPQVEDGDFAYRGVTIESIDAVPTVIIPLQFLPLFEHRRHGTVTYRTVQIATGEITASEGEPSLDLATIDRILNETDLAQLKATCANLERLPAVIDRINAIWSEKSGSGEALGLDALAKAVLAIVSWLRPAVNLRDPEAVVAAVEPDGVSGEDSFDGSPAMAGGAGKVASAAAAAAALDAVAGFFAKSDPSNPALLLVRQAQQMMGKSFVEMMRILVPTHIDSAAIQIGRERSFDLPIAQMADLLGEAESLPVPEIEHQNFAFKAENRGQALALLDNVAGFFRQAEPSNPVPLLMEKAREMAQRDFISVLREVLPDGALKDRR
jgi:type VI secretion system protein ImpA